MRKRKNRHRHSLGEKAAPTPDLRLSFGPDLESNLSVDAYARMNHLSLDYVLEFTSSRLISVIPLGQPLSDTEPYGLTDDSSLTRLHTPSFLSSHTILTEALEVTQDSSDMIDTAVQTGDSRREIAGFLRTSFHAGSSDVTRPGLRLEQPYVRTDTEYDCREVARCIAKKRAIIRPGDFPRESLDEVSDQGLSFPDSAYFRKDDLTAKVRNENFDILRRTFDFMVRQRRGDPPECLLTSVGSRDGSWAMVSLNPGFNMIADD